MSIILSKRFWQFSCYIGSSSFLHFEIIEFFVSISAAIFTKCVLVYRADEFQAYFSVYCSHIFRLFTQKLLFLSGEGRK